MPSRARLDELLDAVKAEFDNLTRETSRYKDDHHEYELKLNQQHQELANISSTVYELEQAHRSMKDAYEREIMKLKQELEVRDRLLEQQSLQQQAVAAQAHAHAHAQHQAQVHAMAYSSSSTPQQLPPPNLSGSATSPSASLAKPDIFNNDKSKAQATTSSLAPIAASTQQQQHQQQQQQLHLQPGLSADHGSTSPAVNTANGLAPLAPAVEVATLPLPAPPADSSSNTNSTPAANGVSAANGIAEAATANKPDAPSADSAPEKSVSTPAATSPVSTSAATTTTTTTAIAPAGETSPAKVEDALVKRAQHNKPIPAFLKDFDAYTSLPYKEQHNDYYIVYNPTIPRKVDVSLVHSFDHTSVVCCVSFSKDGKFLATGCNKLTQVFSIETGDLVARLNDESSVSNNGSYDTDTGDLYIRSVCFSPDGKFLATGAEDKIIRIWDLATRTIVKYLKGHEQDIYSLDFFPDGKRLVSGSGDRTVRIWDVYNGQCSLTLSIEDGVTTVAVSPDGSLIAAGSLDRTVRVWDANKGYLVERLDSSNEFGNGHMDSVYSVTFTNGGKEIASGSLDRTIKLWSLKDLDKQPSSVSKSNCEVTYVGHKDFVLSVCCTPDDEFILSGSKDRGVIMWDKQSGEPYIMLQGHRNSVISVSVSPVVNPKGGYFATGSGDCKARIWKWERVQELN